MAKKALLSACILLAALAAWSGDVAQFDNLGFSSDGRYFMFGQHGILEKTSYPYAELAIVDVPANAFTPQGVKKVSYTKGVEPGSTGLGALLNALGDMAAQKRQYRIDHLVTGRLLYLLVDGVNPAETLEFRDFQAGTRYAVTLVQTPGTKDGQAAAAFSLKVTVTGKDGKAKDYTVGNAGFARAGVKAYRVKQVVLGPDGAALVFVIQKEEADGAGVNIRYMVETVRLD
jgi:predicted secreted protein